MKYCFYFINKDRKDRKLYILKEKTESLLPISNLYSVVSNFRQPDTFNFVLSLSSQVSSITNEEPGENLPLEQGVVLNLSSYLVELTIATTRKKIAIPPNSKLFFVDGKIVGVEKLKQTYRLYVYLNNEMLCIDDICEVGFPIDILKKELKGVRSKEKLIRKFNYGKIANTYKLPSMRPLPNLDCDFAVLNLSDKVLDKIHKSYKYNELIKKHEIEDAINIYCKPDDVFFYKIKKVEPLKVFSLVDIFKEYLNL